jgi:hypothetical protein
MGPRVKPEDDERREVGGKSPTLEIGGSAYPFVILGLDPRTHAVTLATAAGGAEIIPRPLLE